MQVKRICNAWVFIALAVTLAGLHLPCCHTLCCLHLQEPQVGLSTQLSSSNNSSSSAAKAADLGQGSQRLILCHTCYLKASAAAAAVPPEARGFALPSSRHASVGAGLQAGVFVAQQERLMAVPELLLLEQLVATLPLRPSAAYKEVWQQVGMLLECAGVAVVPPCCASHLAIFAIQLLGRVEVAPVMTPTGCKGAGAEGS
jgi:hypothetical protein